MGWIAHGDTKLKRSLATIDERFQAHGKSEIRVAFSSILIGLIAACHRQCPSYLRHHQGIMTQGHRDGLDHTSGRSHRRSVKDAVLFLKRRRGL